jgi:hypothetical protein
MLPALAQTTSLSGVVTDPAGAVIPETIITVTNQATAVTRTTASDGSGAYSLQQLPPGTYMVEAQRPGFSTFRLTEPLRLQVNLPAVLNIQMQLGQVSETVNVVGEATSVSTENATIGNPFVEVQIRQLPIQTRNVVELLRLQPGVTPNGEVNGARRDQNNVTLDGVDVNDNQSSNGFIAALPVPLDSVQEFRTTTAGQTANQGRSSGGQVSLITKSGSNQWHGSLYEFHRNKTTAANNWFSNRAGVPRENLIRNQYGASLGGPMVRDRAFFFFNWEERKDRTAVNTTRTVPSESFKAGILKVRLANGQIGEFSPAEVRAMDPLGIGMNPAVQAFMAQYPAGNDPESSLDRGLNFSILRFNAPKTLNNRALVGKLDFNPFGSGNHTFNVRGTLAANREDDTLAQFPGQPAASQLVDNSRGISTNYTAVLSPTLVNSFTFGLTRLGNSQTGTTASQLSLFFSTPTAFPRPSVRIAPTYNFTDDLTWTKGRHTWQFGTNIRLIRNDRITYSNFPTYSFSRNTLKGLGQDITTIVNAAALAKYGSGVPTAQNVNVQNAMGAMLGVLNQYSATYQFQVSGGTIPFGGAVPRSFSTDEYEFYFMDTFKVKPNLTLTYGLRYGLYTPVYEAKGEQVIPSIDPDIYFADRAGGQLLGAPAFAVANPRLTFIKGGAANGADSWYRTDTNNFAPRLALAYTPDFLGKGTVIRAGAGVTYDRYGSNMAVSFAANGSPGLSTQLAQPLNTDFTDSPRFGIGPLPQLTPPVVTGYPFTPPEVFGGFNSFQTVSRNLVAPYQFLLNFSIAKPIVAKTTLEVGYVGRLSRKSLLRMDYGQPLTRMVDPASGQNWMQASAILRDLFESGVTAAQVRANPSLVPLMPFIENVFPAARNDRFPGSASANYFNAVYGVYAQSDLDALQDYDRVRRANGRCISKWGCNSFFPLQNSGLLTWTNAGNGSYHGMQVVYRRPVQNGWGFDFNYTWSHAIDNASASESNASTIQDSFCTSCFRGPSDFDIRHNITANAVIETPFGRGKRFLGNVNKWVDGVVGGWQIAALVSYRTGFPITLTNGGVFSTNYLSSSFAVLRPGAQMPKTGVQLNQNGNPSWVANTNVASLFMGAYPGQVGTRGIFRGPSVSNVDLSLGKYFTMPWEGHRLQVRGEAFNAFNAVNFTGMQTSIVSATFGQFSGTQPARVMQFALRYEF